MTGATVKTMITGISPRRENITTDIIIPAGIGFQALTGVASACAATAALAVMKMETGISNNSRSRGGVRSEAQCGNLLVPPPKLDHSALHFPFKVLVTRVVTPSRTPKLGRLGGQFQTRLAPASATIRMMASNFRPLMLFAPRINDPKSNHEERQRDP